jgi:hypothetical protein
MKIFDRWRERVIERERERHAMRMAEQGQWIDVGVRAILAVGVGIEAFRQLTKPDQRGPEEGE